MTIWISKYALTKGVYSTSEGAPEPNGAYYIKPSGGWAFGQWFRKGMWHTTHESAVKKAEEMRQKKIQSLKKQIAALEDMSFEERK